MTLSSFQSGLQTDTRYDLAILNIWSDTFTAPAILGGVESCQHLDLIEVSKSEQICSSCGANIFIPGKESDPIDYYKHIYQMINSINAKTVVLEAERYYPSEYSPVKTARSLRKYRGNFTCVTRHLSYFYLNTKLERPQRVANMSFYSEEDNFLLEWHNKVVGVRETLNLRDLFSMHTKVLHINPRMHEIGFNVEGVDYIVPNETVALSVSDVY